MSSTNPDTQIKRGECEICGEWSESLNRWAHSLADPGKRLCPDCIAEERRRLEKAQGCGR